MLWFCHYRFARRLIVSSWMVGMWLGLLPAWRKVPLAAVGPPALGSNVPSAGGNVVTTVHRSVAWPRRR